MRRFDFVLKQFRLEDEGLKPRRGQSINREYSLHPPARQCSLCRCGVFPNTKNGLPRKANGTGDFTRPGALGQHIADKVKSLPVKAWLLPPVLSVISPRTCDTGFLGFLGHLRLRLSRGSHESD